jgi:phenylacetate-CoA ligase
MASEVAFAPELSPGHNFFCLRKNLGKSVGGLSSLEISQIWPAFRELERTQWEDPANIVPKQLAQLRNLLAHCLAQVPYYQREFASANISPPDLQSLTDWQGLPILEREMVQEHFSDLCAPNLPPGLKAIGKISTSGTTGVPVQILQTNAVHLFWYACYLRDLQWCGIDPGGTLAVIRPTHTQGENLERWRAGVSLSTWNPVLNNLIEMGPLHAMDITQDPHRQLEWLRRVNPDYLLSYPGNLEQLAGLLAETGERIPNLRIVQAIAETLSADAQARIEAAFGVPVKMNYSCCEAGYLASSCPLGHGLHVHSENVLLELVDREGRPCRPGESGRVLLTTLHNYLTPLIRYNIQDEATLAPGPCPCGRGLPLLVRVDGKVRPWLLLPNGQRKNSVGLILDLRRIGAYRQHQLIQQAPDRLLVRVVPTPEWTPGHVKRIQELTWNFFGTRICVDVETVDRIPLSPGGKMKDVVCL